MAWRNRQFSQQVKYASASHSGAREGSSKSDCGNKTNNDIDDGKIEKLRRLYMYRRPATATTPVPECGLQIATIGYGGSTTQNFIDKLKAHGVITLVDIRINPYCGFNRDFNSQRMETILREHGIEYHHFLELGNLFKGSIAWDEDTEPYTLLLQQSGLLLTQRLRKLVESKGSNGKVAILCACKEHIYCHRNVVAGYLQLEHGYKITHIDIG